jgi:death-on-curing protein
VIYLDVDDLLHIGGRVLGGSPMVRDLGLLEAACARPKASYAGAELYPTLETKAASLIHSIAKNHALVDGNKRLATTTLIAFLGINGAELTFDNDELYRFALAIASGALDDVESIALEIAAHIRPRR